MAEDFFPEFDDSIEENESPIQFFSEAIDFTLINEASISDWIKAVIFQENKDLHQLNFILCNDEYLHKINLEYLNHDTLTDIITFPYSDPPVIHSDIYISVERVEDNAKCFNVAFNNELHRVIIHGVLHLCGYGDKTEDEEKLMRQKEDEALKLIKVHS
jgi:rRNA maturation RNase YbeY